MISHKTAAVRKRKILQIYKMITGGFFFLLLLFDEFIYGFHRTTRNRRSVSFFPFFCLLATVFDDLAGILTFFYIYIYDPTVPVVKCAKFSA